MRHLSRRLEVVEQKLGRVDEAEQWEESRAWWEAYLPILRDWLSGEITRAEHDAWRLANGGPDADKPLTPWEQAKKDRAIAEVMQQLGQMSERLHHFAHVQTTGGKRPELAER